MKYLVVILFSILLILLIKSDLFEKFNEELISPEVIEVIKKGDNAHIKFKNTSKGLKNFMIFYINVEKPESGIWVEKS